MDGQLQKAINLREKGLLIESNSLLLELVSECPDEALINYHCAWSYDALGEEAKAVPYYEKAIQLGLADKDLEGALLGLGSTYRTLGQYGNAKKTLLKAIECFPNNKALQVFYAMTLYNLKQHHEAMELLLHCIAETSQDHNILDYKNAIEFYANKLDETWK
ncbi:tetratricopeptide repeat protein [Rummeliibacillus pycnus]|uniref:tetratricopeptide repeat protein n=1 Tax=Rummeliibacillus pycnus TaxID=101070 RepID=UPI003D2D1BF8